MLYSEMAGLEITLQDKNLILSSDSAPQANTVLCIAPIWEDDGSNIPPADEGLAPAYDAVTIKKGEDFALNNLGQYATRNPLAKLWKQASDAGASAVKVIRLHGKTKEERYIGLHNILSILGDYDAYDVLVVGGVFTNDQLFSNITDAEELLLAQRNLLLTAYDADTYVSLENKTATISKTTIDEVAGQVSIKIGTGFVATDKISVAEKTITFYATDTAKGEDAFGISLETSTTATAQATAISAMTFPGYTVTNPTSGEVLFVEAVVGSKVITSATVIGSGALISNVATSAVIEDTLYILEDEFVEVASMLATPTGTFTTNSFSYFMGTQETNGKAYVAMSLEGSEVFPSTIEVKYSYTSNTDEIDQIDGAKKLIKKGSVNISGSDIGSGKLVVPSIENGISKWVIDLSTLDDFDKWNNGDFIVSDANGEVLLEGVAWTIETVSSKTLTFYKAPIGYSFTFPTQSSFDFGAMIASFLNSVNASGKQVIGVMSLIPAKNNSLKAIKEYVANSPLLQYSKYLQVVGGPEQIFQLNGTIYKDSWHGAYAGMLAVLPSYEAPLNKPIPGVIKQDYQLSSMQSLTLTNKHIIVSRKRGNYIVCSDPVTTAEDTSDFIQITTLRIVNDAINLVKEIADPFIGKPNTIEIRAAMETSIKSGLEGMIKAGALTDFRFAVLSTAAEQLEGTMRIALELVPVFTVRKIRVSVAVRPSL